MSLYKNSIILGVMIFISSLFCTALLIFAFSQSNRINEFFINATPTPRPTLILSPTPTFTLTPTLTETPVPTLTPTNKPTNTAVPTSIPTNFPSEISRGNTSKKQVIFTFDAGSGAQSAQDILDVAASHGLTLSFFLTGKWAEQNPGFTQAFANGGHEIYNHTYSHFKSEIWRPDLIDRQGFENWEASGSKTFRDRVHERVVEILDAKEEPLMDVKMFRELRHICELADDTHKGEELDFDMFSKAG